MAPTPPPTLCLLSWMILLYTCVSFCHGVVPVGCNGRVDLTFIMDQSESIRENDPYDQPDYNWNLFKDFIKAVIKGLPVGSDTQVAMVKYSDMAEVVWTLNQYTYAYDMEVALSALQHLGGNTNTADALQKTREEIYMMSQGGNRTDARDVIVLMTDGLSTRRQHDVKAEAVALRAAGAEIYVVAIGKYTDEAELRDIVQDFSRNILRTQDFERLAAITELLTYRVCDLPDPEPDNQPPSDCTGLMDLAFIVDNSGSIRDKNKDGDNYDRLKGFLANLVDQLDIGIDKTRVGTVRFSDIAEVEFRLDTFTDKESVKAQIRAMAFRGSHTNTSGAIRLTMQEIFNSSHGDRPNVRNVGLIVTDGESTREKNTTIPEAVQAKNRGVELYVVGVTDQINKKELKEIASSPPDEHFFDSTEIRYLNSILYRLLKKVCRSS